jgi:hypothetical protein
MIRIGFIVAAFVVLTVSFSLAGSESTVIGTYLNKADKEYMTLNPDGTFHLKLRKRPVDPENPFINTSGKYRVTGDEIKLELEDGGEASGKMQGTTFVDNEGKSWMKEGTIEPPRMDASPKKGLRNK